MYKKNAAQIRLFSVIKYESVIHEFDPYFNYRISTLLTKDGFYNIWNFFDPYTWYPLGRVVGGTMYPGLIFTAGVIWNILHWLRIPIHIQEVCVFMGPIFSALTSLSAFGLVREVRGSGAGLAAAALISVVPSYISRSVAGSYDLEAVAIFALVFVFFLYVKTLNTGSLAWATALFFGYLYMVASWGGYSFIVNLLPIHCFACIFFGRVSSRLYVAYAPFVILGALACMNIPVIGFNAVLMSEHFASFFIFAFLHAVLGIQYIKKKLPARHFEAAKRAVLSVAGIVLAIVFLMVVTYITASPTLGWTGRSLSLLDPTYASKYIPIIASVSEHQPPSWSMYFTDLHILTLLAPAGLLLCFFPMTDASLFLALYGVTAVYFSGVMVRLMLVLAPAACCLGGIALHEALTVLGTSISMQLSSKSYPEISESSTTSKTKEEVVKDTASSMGQKKKSSKISQKKVSAPSATGRSARISWSPLPFDVAIVATIGLMLALATYFRHGVYVAGEMYSSPSVVLQTRSRDGSVTMLDDFREAYSWLNYNTPPDTKIASWWDYGYQTSAMSNRTVIVDNNTWNNTHIATVGRALASPEEKAWKILRSLDVDYFFVVFGGLLGYPSDDINKLLWPIRIGSGVYPEIREEQYLTERGGYSVGEDMGPALRESLAYKLSYYRFAEVTKRMGLMEGFDRVRQTVIGLKEFELEYFEEAFSSENWLVRVYRVLPEPNVDAAEKKS